MGSFENMQVENGKFQPVKTERFPAVGHGVPGVGPRPVKHGHEIIANRFYTAGGQVF
ncbi:hypothetical protein D9M69_647690 [compost metagenome]